MLNPDATIICQECGSEFVSFVVVAQTTIGCTERCPCCGTDVNSPTLIGGINPALFGTKPPMIRDYGEHGYVYLGAGLTESMVQDLDLIPIRAAYTRNFGRVLKLLDLVEAAMAGRTSKDAMPALLASAIILTRTSYEVLMGDLSEVLSDRLGPSLEKPKSGFEKEKKVFDILSGLLKIDNLSAHRAAIRFMSIVRHSLAHAGGFVDKTFMADYSKLIGENPGNWPLHREGELLGFDLSVVTSLCDSVQQVSHSVLRAAQRRLASGE